MNMMNEELESIRNKCVDSLRNSANYVLKYLDGNEKNNEMNKLQSYVQKYCFLDQLSDLEEIKDFIDQEDNEICKYEDFEAQVLELDKNLNYNNHAYMESFMDIRKNQQDPSSPISEDQEVEIMQITDTNIDPITKQPIKMPVKNKICGHLYDLTSISQYMTSRNNAKCPYVACLNVIPITMKVLIQKEQQSTIQVTQDYDDSMEVE